MKVGELGRHLGKHHLLKVLSLSDDCLNCVSEEGLHDIILDLARFLGYEHVLYAHMRTSYQRHQQVELKNLSNPREWMQEYAKSQYLLSDPIRIELEHRLAGGQHHGFITWDDYQRPVSVEEKRVIERRREHGLHFGGSVFHNSPKQDAVFLLSFGSASRRVDAWTQQLCRLLAPHLNRCRKRLDIQALVSRLSAKEQAVAKWLAEGKSNWEIAQILCCSESTAKFHVANILAKLEVHNRQHAAGILLAERYLSC